MPNVGPPFPQEIQDILDVMNENVNTFITNRERIHALFDQSVGVSAKSLIQANDWTILRDLWVTELSDAVSGLQSTVFQIQNLT
jgi:hypothetical protein